MRNTDYQFHTSTKKAWQAMLQACENAEQSILLEEYIFDPDTIGSRFLKVIEKKTKEGVKIKLLLDWWGCRHLYYSSVPSNLRKLGVDVLFYRTPHMKWLMRPNHFFPRDHRKLLIVDESVAYIGGVCVYDTITTWRDTMVELKGGLTDKLCEFFDQTWKHVPDQTCAYQVLEGIDEKEKFNLYANTIHAQDRSFYTHLLKRMEGAKHSFKMTTPYFVPDTKFIDALLKAKERGIEIDLLLSNRPKYAPYVVGKQLLKELLESGINIHYYLPDMLHLKMLIIDDAWSAIGSFNLDELSMHQNEELMLTSTEPSFTQELLQHFDRDLQESEQYSLEDWKTRPATEKVMGKLLLPFRSYL